MMENAGNYRVGRYKPPSGDCFDLPTTPTRLEDLPHPSELWLYLFLILENISLHSNTRELTVNCYFNAIVNLVRNQHFCLVPVKLKHATKISKADKGHWRLFVLVSSFFYIFFCLYVC